jgi:YVTN family beta-propeller protein
MGHAYVANNGSNTVSVIARPGNTVVANIPVGTGPVGVAAFNLQPTSVTASTL